MSEIESDRKQVAAQCRVVVHLAKALVEVHADYATMFDDGYGLATDQTSIDMIGRRTARFMEHIGNMLNGIDAVSEEDDWTNPVFEAAHKRWPTALTPTPLTENEDE